MKTASQLADLSLWQQAEAALAEALERQDTISLVLWAAELHASEDPLAPLAVFAIMYEVHRREQL